MEFAGLIQSFCSHAWDLRTCLTRAPSDFVSVSCFIFVPDRSLFVKAGSFGSEMFPIGNKLEAFGRGGFFD